MAYVERHAFDVVTSASGAFTGYSPVITGQIAQYRYVPSTNNMASTADLDIVGEVTGLIIADQDNIGLSAFTKAPRGPVHDVAGVGRAYSSAAPLSVVTDIIRVANERLKLTIAQGGDTKNGKFYIWVA
jgi:hypothetical protein